MDHHHPPPLPQQHGDHYRPLVLSPQPDHAHALQYQQQPQQQQQQATPPPQHHHPSLASHFHLLHLVTRLGDAIATGTRDQAFDALVEELTSQFARSQQLLNSISGTLSSKSVLLTWEKYSVLIILTMVILLMTVEGQMQSLEETRQLLDQRKDLIAKYKSSVEDLLKGDPTR
ncbi:unnamed protein product [Triticum turgidum subsp. durum]|uniref:Uncharacterized protein n=1 Tax=Triticum turgidum subsp. durum TaxID=4567 RepID=A0A9R1Q7C8_TRITD|nr:unnamed protein product [Triticum turgidum subsp. durum]